MANIEATAVKQYRRDGYAILSGVLSEDQLASMRDECSLTMRRMDEEMDRLGVDHIGGTRRGLQYFPGNCSQQQPGVRRFALSSLMAQVCTALIGENSYLFWEQFAVKFGEDRGAGARVGTFAANDGPSSLGLLSWHQDSGYVPHDHAPYLTCWVALDDVTSDNGAVRLIPHTELGIKTRVQHVPSPDNGDLVGYFGELKGVEATAPAGSIVCFSSTVFHSSDRNYTAQPRRAFIAQYSTEPIMSADGARVWNRAEQLTAAGEYVGATTIAQIES